MDNLNETSVKHIVEGLIFAADEPITPKQIRELVEGDSTNGSSESSGLSPQRIRMLIDELNEDYEKYSRPYRIQAIAGGYIFSTNREVSTFVGKLHREQSKRRLTQAALETLAIIAYKQPMTKVELENIRGVNSDYIVKSLLEKDLITIVGRESTPGRPLLYGTTNRFLIHFGLNSINELPKPREIEELIGETELEVEKRLMELEKRKQDEEEEAQQKRERKPHPLSKGATAKIIPLKPDYRPLKKQEPKFEDEEQPAAETEETRQREKETGTQIEKPERRDKQKKVEEKVELQEERMREHDEISKTELEPEQPEEVKEKVDQIDKEPEVERVPEHQVDRQPVHQEINFEREERESERGWKKWKNKIVKIIKKIFG